MEPVTFRCSLAVDIKPVTFRCSLAVDIKPVTFGCSLAVDINERKRCRAPTDPRHNGPPHRPTYHKNMTMKEPRRNIACSVVDGERNYVKNRKRHRGEVGSYHTQHSHLFSTASASAAAAALVSCLAVASALTHVPLRPRFSHHAFRLRAHMFSRKSAARARQTQTQLSVNSASRSSMSLDEIPTSLERTNDRRIQNWSIRYSDLVEYKRKHGHTNVPLSHSDTKLAIWVRNQRHQFRHLLHGRRSTMTRDRYEKLCAIDFDFGTPFREAWDRRCQELIAFKKKHGHCNVPQLWDENPALSRWVALQRLCYRNSQLEMKPDISEDRVQALEDIGFEWAVNDKKWRDMLERTQKTLFFVQDDAAEEDEEESKATKLERRPDWTNRTIATFAFGLMSKGINTHGCREMRRPVSPPNASSRSSGRYPDFNGSDLEVLGRRRQKKSGWRRTGLRSSRRRRRSISKR